MAQTIRLRRSSTADAEPTTAQLALGEVAINTYDGKMFIKKNDGSDSIVELGVGGGNSVYVKTTVTATANQTTVTAVPELHHFAQYVRSCQSRDRAIRQRHRELL